MPEQLHGPRLICCRPLSLWWFLPLAVQRYKQLLFFATKLEPFPAEAHTEENKVKGCVSQVRQCSDMPHPRLPSRCCALRLPVSSGAAGQLPQLPSVSSLAVSLPCLLKNIQRPVGSRRAENRTCTHTCCGCSPAGLGYCRPD
jgi:hypothetical protein